MKVILSIISQLILMPCFSQIKNDEQPDLIKDSTAYVDLLNRSAMLLHEKEPDSTFYYAKEARAVAERLQYKKGTADALNGLGIVCAYHNNPQLALHYFNDSYNIYQNIRDSSNSIKLLMNISRVLCSHDKKEKGLLYMQKALILGNEISDDSIMSLVLPNYILNFSEKISKDSAWIYLEKAKRISKAHYNERIFLIIQQAEASFCLQNNQPDTAIALLQKSLLTANKNGDNYQSINILTELGNYYFKTTDTAKAIDYLKQALSISESKNYDVTAKKISEKLYNYYSAKKSINDATVYAEKLVRLNEDEENRNNISGIDYLEYAIKDQQLEEATIKNKNRELTIIALSIVSVLFLALLSFIYRLYRLKKIHTGTLQQLNNIVTRKNERLQSNQAFNNTIISILAHDFRQPLTAIQTLSTLLKNIHSLPQERLDKLIKTMENSAETSLSSFANILQYIKPQLAGFVYEPVSFNLQILINEVVEPFLATAREDHIILQNMVAENIRIEADREMIQFINRNLIHNAVKFSPQNSTITISAQLVAKEIIVSIDDEGKGIEADTLGSLFYFKNEQDFEHRKEKGAGIALIICKDLIERMNGRIWAESSKEKGAVFYYALPALLAQNDIRN